MGYKVEAHGPVVLFDSELNANVFNSRAVALCNGLRWRNTDLYYMPAVGVPLRSFPKLHEFAEIIKAKAVVVDSLGLPCAATPSLTETYATTRPSTSTPS